MNDYAETKKAETREAPYIQFPLAVLALYEDKWIMMDKAISYGVVNFAKKQTQKFKQDPEWLQRFREWEPPTEVADYIPAKLTHKAVALAFHVLEINGPVQGVIDTWKDIRKHIRNLGIDPDKTVFVRIPKSRAFGLRDKWEGLNENDVRVLLAIISKQGNKPYVVMTREEIAYRAAGAKDEQEWKNIACPDLLSKDQVSRSLKKLSVVRRLIGRLLLWGRINFMSYQTDCGYEELKQMAKQWLSEQQDNWPAERKVWRYDPPRPQG